MSGLVGTSMNKTVVSNNFEGSAAKLSNTDRMAYYMSFFPVMSKVCLFNEAPLEVNKSVT